MILIIERAGSSSVNVDCLCSYSLELDTVDIIYKNETY